MYDFVWFWPPPRRSFLDHFTCMKTLQNNHQKNHWKSSGNQWKTMKMHANPIDSITLLYLWHHLWEHNNPLEKTTNISSFFDLFFVLKTLKTSNQKTIRVLFDFFKKWSKIDAPQRLPRRTTGSPKGVPNPWQSMKKTRFFGYFHRRLLR